MHWQQARRLLAPPVPTHHATPAATASGLASIQLCLLRLPQMTTPSPRPSCSGAHPSPRSSSRPSCLPRCVDTCMPLTPHRSPTLVTAWLTVQPAHAQDGSTHAAPAQGKGYSSSNKSPGSGRTAASNNKPDSSYAVKGPIQYTNRKLSSRIPSDWDLDLSAPRTVKEERCAASSGPAHRLPHACSTAAPQPDQSCTAFLQRRADGIMRGTVVAQGRCVCMASMLRCACCAGAPPPPWACR